MGDEKNLQDLEKQKLEEEIEKLRSERRKTDLEGQKVRLEREKITHETRDLGKWVVSKSFWQTFMVALIAAVVALTIGWWQTAKNQAEPGSNKQQTNTALTNSSTASSSDNAVLTNTLVNKADEIISVIKESGKVIQVPAAAPPSPGRTGPIEVKYTGKPLVTIPSGFTISGSPVITVKREDAPAPPQGKASLVNLPKLDELKQGELENAVNAYILDKTNVAIHANLLRLISELSNSVETRTALITILDANLFMPGPVPYSLQPPGKITMTRISDGETVEEEKDLIQIAEMSLKVMRTNELESFLIKAKSFFDLNSTILTDEEKNKIKSFLSAVVTEWVKRP